MLKWMVLWKRLIGFRPNLMICSSIKQFICLWPVLILVSHLGCSSSEPALRGIRAHTVDLNGIGHGAAYMKAERYCSYCHGATLQGGDSGEPSCFRCHGKNWFDLSSDLSSAPTATHTVSHGGFNHHSDLNSPEGTCNSCHGENLEGENNNPSCLICHEKLWE